jgi:hypothetical protein
MPTRKNPPLSFCEYVYPPSRQSTATQQARRELMKKVRECYPLMLKALSDNVFQHYAKLCESGFDFEAILWNARISPYSWLPEGLLKSALQNWAARFRATEDWFLDDALRTLRGWFVAPDWRDELRWHPIGSVIRLVAVGERFSFHCEGWEVQGFTWEYYSRSVRERFEQALREYETTTRKLAESHGLIRAPRKYSAANFEWFVLYQFAGLSSKQIADRITKDNPSDDSTVLKGVKAAAKLLAWAQVRESKKLKGKIR